MQSHSFEDEKVKQNEEKGKEFLLMDTDSFWYSLREGTVTENKQKKINIDSENNNSKQPT